MPVTIRVTDYAPSRWRGDRVSGLKSIFKDGDMDPESLLESSLTKASFDASHISLSPNGFVCAVLEAYNHRHNLILRPQDVWFAILSQIGMFNIRDNESDLQSPREKIPHEKKKVVSVTVGRRKSFDCGEMTSLMTDQFKHALPDSWGEDLEEWYKPPFASATHSDKMVGSLLTMGNMQKYCDYAVSRTCGIPSVTLLGEREDWVNLFTKVEAIPWAGDEVAKFSNILQPVLDRLITSFEEPKSSEVQRLWARCVHGRGDGSWATQLTGWITVFCFWDEKGRLPRGIPNHMTGDLQLRAEEEDLLEALCGEVDLKSIPRGYSTVPINLRRGLEEKPNTIMVGGSVGIKATASSRQPSGEAENALRNLTSPSHEDRCLLDTIQPLSAWWIYKTK
ncbi:unnamed protein product [Penicillium salamii]|nr:unnamed protein product [Penicillium salamii]